MYGKDHSSCEYPIRCVVLGSFHGDVHVDCLSFWMVKPWDSVYEKHPWFCICINHYNVYIYIYIWLYICIYVHMIWSLQITTNHYTLSGGMTDEVQPNVEWAKPCLFQAAVSGGGHLGSSWASPNTLEVKFMDNPMKTRMMTGDTPISGNLQMEYSWIY